MVNSVNSSNFCLSTLFIPEFSRVLCILLVILLLKVIDKEVNSDVKTFNVHVYTQGHKQTSSNETINCNKNNYLVSDNNNLYLSSLILGCNSLKRILMEEIYPPESYGASSHLPWKTYFENLSNNIETLPTVDVDGEVNETEYLLAIKELMNLDVTYNDIKQLSKICSTDSLTCIGEDTKNFPIELPEHINSNSKLPFPFIVTDSDNLAVNKCWSEIESLLNPIGNKRNYHNTLDFVTPAALPDLHPGLDFVISVLIYRPVAFRFFNAKNASEKLRFNHEILVLGRNTLTELRDAIVCSADFGLCKEVESTSSDLKPLANAKSIYPSGFIYIDGVFYNDFRDPNAIDYSFPIIEWAKEKKIQTLRARSMEDVPIKSLTPRLGYPYVYMHQGDCEHLFVFADARLLDSSDCLHSECYPHILKLNRSANKMCFMCSVSFAKWICVGSNRLPQHKVFLCTDCCNAYNYIDGKKIGNFKLYPYYEKHVVV